MAKKLSDAQRKALEALTHDEHTRIVLLNFNGPYYITNHRGFGQDVRETTYRALWRMGYLKQLGSYGTSAISAAGRKALEG